LTILFFVVLLLVSFPCVGSEKEEAEKFSKTGTILGGRAKQVSQTIGS